VGWPKGYFPVPALRHLDEPFLTMVRDTLYAPEAKERGLAVLEMWHQQHGVG
jgi:asparagine synthase (glutamine-hydrolysing)